MLKLSFADDNEAQSLAPRNRIIYPEPEDHETKDRSAFIHPVGVTRGSYERLRFMSLRQTVGAARLSYLDGYRSEKKILPADSE